MKYGRGDNHSSAPLKVGDSVVWMRDDGPKQGVVLKYDNSPDQIRKVSVYFVSDIYFLIIILF